MLINKDRPDQQAVTWKVLSIDAASALLKERGSLVLGRILVISGIIFALSLFLPWRQTIPGMGTVTALRPQDRPQTIQNQIGGRIEYWAVTEGQEVKRGDTILVLSETAQSYFDPMLPLRLEEQLHAKRSGADAADQKMKATEAQIDALRTGLDFQLESAKNKVIQSQKLGEN
jgi:hypothetical protein